MSVIILGMEMPKKCEDCEIETCDENYYGDEFNHRCSLLYKGYTRRCRNAGRLDDCPLRPLPEKHGRLGDLDKLKTSFADSINGCKKWIKELEEDGDNETLVIAKQAFCTFVDAALRVKSIPTIVEAEGD